MRRSSVRRSAGCDGRKPSFRSLARMKASTGFLAHARSAAEGNAGMAGVERFCSHHARRSASVYVGIGATASEANPRHTSATAGVQRKNIPTPPRSSYFRILHFSPAVLKPMLRSLGMLLLVVALAAVAVQE